MNKIIRTICSVFTAAGSVTALTLALALALALPLSTAQASSDFIVYQGVAFNDGTAVASTPISLRFTILKSDGLSPVYQETQTGVATTDKGFFFHQIGSGTSAGVVFGPKSGDDGSAPTYAEIIWADGYLLRVEVDYNNGTDYTDLGFQALSSSVYAIRAKTATQLATARTIGGVSFDGTENIDLPGVNAAGTQDTSGNAATATRLATARTINGIAFDGSANITAPNNLAQGTRTTTTVPVTSSTGTNATLQAATTTLAGVMSSADKTKLNGIAVNANNYTHPGSHSADFIVPNVNRRFVTDTQINTWNNKQNAVTGAASTITANNLTASRALVSNASGKVAASTITAAELERLSGLTVNIKSQFDAVQSQLNQRLSTSGGTIFEGSLGLISPSGSHPKLGIGTAPNYPLHIAGGDDRNFSYGYLNSSGGTGARTATRALSIFTTSAIAGLNIYAHSDTRIKEDIQPIGNALSLINELEPMSYTMIDKVAHGSGVSYGFIAQNLEVVIPEAVTKSFGEVPVLKLFDDVVFEEGVTYTLQVRNAEEESQQEYTTGQERPEGEVFVINKKVDDFRTVDYNMIFTQAVAAIKEQQVLIEALQNELKEIKKELRATNQSNR